MPTTNSQRTIGIWVFSLLAGAFGFLTITSGGSVLFIDGEARAAAGHYVPFVLWFNFGAGFVYVFTSITLWLLRPSAVWLALLITASTLSIFAALGLHVLNGGEYETRTVSAMILRSGVWIVISAFTWYHFRRHRTSLA